MTARAAGDLGAWRAVEGDTFDLVVDVRPEAARTKHPYPAPALAWFADELVDNLDSLLASWPPPLRICCVCWSGQRAARCVFHLLGAGYEARWFALSPAARRAFD